MFKRTFLATAIGAAMIMGSVGSANALEITAGNYKITFDSYASGTLGYGNTSGIKCATVAACDAVIAGTPGAVQAPGTSSDTAGILSVASITNLLNGVTEYVRGTASTLSGIVVGPYLTGVFGGLDDHYVEVAALGGAMTLANAVGGFFNIYSNAADYLPANGAINAGVNLDAGTYAGITDGAPSSLFLSGVFASGAVAGDTTTTYTTTYNNATTAGLGQGYLDFTGGDAYAFFNTNSLTNNNGTKNDAFIKVTFGNPNGAASDIGWTVQSTGDVSGEVGEVPEPGSIALISLAMLGLGAMTRRRNKQSDSEKG